jgi:hypothetical protein
MNAPGRASRGSDDAPGDDDLDAFRGALYKRKDFLGVEEEGESSGAVVARARARARAPDAARA